MKKFLAILFAAALLAACGDDNSSSATDDISSSSEKTTLSSSVEETSVESSSDNEINSSSSEKKNEQKSSSSSQKASSSSNNTTSSSLETKVESSSDAEKSSSSKNMEPVLDFGDNEIIIKQIPTYRELNGKPYFYTTQPRCIYKDGVFSLKADTSDNAYFYAIANDTLTLSLVDLEKVLAGTLEEPNAKETYYGQNTILESKWEHLCYYNLSGDDYISCNQKYSYLISKDTIYIIQAIPFDHDYEIFAITEKVSHTAFGPYDEMSATERSTAYAENGISIDSSNAKILITIKDKGTLSIDELSISVIDKENASAKISVSAGERKCSYTASYNQNPVKYCSEEYLPYLSIDSYDGYVYAYRLSNQEEFDTCLESLFD